MMQILDLERFPIHQPDSARYMSCVDQCRAELAATGMFNLDGLLRADAAAFDAARILPRIERDGFHHKRAHNIYFSDAVPGLAADHPALMRFETSNHTLCADQLHGCAVLDVYTYAPLRRFLADVMELPALHEMADPLARLNVMQYSAGDALNWHFDRSEFTVTLLLQAPDAGGLFEYRTDLRTAEAPNYDGVARMLDGRDPQVQSFVPTPGSLNVFRGKNTAHRVTPVEGETPRLIAVLSYYERAGVRFSSEEQMGFYGRSVTDTRA